MGLSRDYDLKTDGDVVNFIARKRRKTISRDVQLWVYFFWLSKYNQKYNFGCIDFFVTFVYICSLNLALLKAGSRRKNEINQAVHGARVRFCQVGNEMELQEDIERTLGGISNEKDISDISHFNFLIHFFVPLSK
jgi:hypothetical protein